MSKRRWWILLPLAALAAALILVVPLFGWNWFKGPIEGAASTALGREVEIAGDLEVDLSATPIITLEQVRIANAAWGSRPHMLTILRVDLAVRLWPLLRGRVELPFLRVKEPDLLLETNREGEGNWQFGPPDEPAGAPAIPMIGDLQIAGVAVRYRAPGRAQDLVAALDVVAGAITSNAVRLNADGALNEEPLSVRLASAPVERLEPETDTGRFPFQLDARIGPNQIAATGSAEALLQAQGLSVEIAVASEEPETLLVLAGREPRDLGPLALDLALTRQDEVWGLHGIDLRLGESDLTGEVTFSDQGEVPVLSADLRSREIRLAEVQDVISVLTEDTRAPRHPTLEGTLADAKEALESEPEESNAVPSAEPDASPDTLPALEAEVSWRIERLSGRDLLVRDLELYGGLQDRLPYFALGGEGQYQGEPVTLAARVGDPTTTGDTYPVRAELAAAGTTIRLDGALTRPEELAGLDLRFDVESRNVGPLLALAEIEAPPIPPFEAHGRLAQGGAAWQLTEFDGRIGESDVQGRATVTLGEQEPVITAELASDQVRLEDLEPLMPGVDAPTSEPDPDAALDTAIAEARAALADHEQAPAGGFGLHPDTLPPIDAQLSYAVARLTGPELDLADLKLHARLDEGLPRLTLTGGGEYQGAPVTLDVHLGRVDQATPADGAYSIEARIEAAGTEAQIEGLIGEPETLERLDLQVQVASEDINRVLTLANVDAPQIPPFAISGHVVQDGQVWRIDDFYGQFHESELAGQLTTDLSEQRPFITAELESSRLRVSDLVTAGDRAAVVGDEVAETAGDAEGDERQETGAEPEGGDTVRATEAEESAAEVEDDAAAEDGEAALISLEGLNFEALPRIDADVSFRGQSVQYEEYRFDRLSFDLQLRDQVAVLDATGEGQFRDGPLSLEAHLGTEQTLQGPDARYPIDIQIASEETRLTVEGTSAEPGRLAGLRVDVTVSGPNLDRVGEILQLSMPTTPPFDLQSQLTHEENHWNFVGLNGTIGDSDVQGDAAIVLGGERPLLEAELTSNALDFDDLGLLVGAPADPDETVSDEQAGAAVEQAAQEELLPDEPFDVPELRAMDARVSYQAKQVQAQKLPLQGMAVDLTLENGQLTLEPLRFDLADGELDSVIRLDGRTDTLTGDLELNVRNVRLNQLLSRFDMEIAEIEMEQEGVGTFGGQAELEVRGNSIQELAGSADGKIALIMGGGRINALIVEGLGLDLGEAIALLLSGEEKEQSEMVPVQCLVARFDVRDGIMQAEALVLETSDSTITGSGHIDLGEETLALELLAHPKDASALSASTPVRIEGTFKNAEIDLVSEELQEKSLAALALGVVLPVIGAIIPFVEEGETEDTNCARLIQDASAAMQTESLEGED